MPRHLKESRMPIVPPERLLLGPGPSPVHPRISAALAAPIVGHLDPWFLGLMDEIAASLRGLFGTTNPLTLPISGTGSAGMDAAFANLVEPGDSVVIGVNGLFGQRMREVASRYGAHVTAIEKPWGEAISAADLAVAIETARPKIIALVHAETSTGVLQPIEPLLPTIRNSGALFVLDTVTSIAGVPLELDQWGVDACYAGTQKCLNVPPGLAPFTMSPRAVEALRARRTPVPVWYLDMTLVASYWGEGRVYHHTAPISMLYGLREGLAIVEEETMAARAERHRLAARRLYAGLEALGLKLHVEPELRLPPLTTVRIPDGVDDAALRGRLLREDGIEIGGAIGELRGRVWRIGLMGHGARLENIVRVLDAIARGLEAQGRPADGAAAVAAAVAAGGQIPVNVAR
jgi:alanine-glyoxylate transaminase/serine-glyoxylate transaminase/serine-pyruvate transaminase